MFVGARMWGWTKNGRTKKSRWWWRSVSWPTRRAKTSSTRGWGLLWTTQQLKIQGCVKKYWPILYIYLILLLCSSTFSPPGPWGKYFAFQRCLVRMATGQYAVADQMQRNSPSRSGSNSCKASSSPQMSRVSPWGMGIARNLQGSPPNSLFDEPTTRYWPSLSNDLYMNIVGMSST